MDFPPTNVAAAEQSLNAGFRRLLSEYSGIDEADHVRHLVAIRNRCSFTKSPFFASYRFTDVSIARHDEYPHVLQRIKGERHLLLDLGCGLGQNLRQLIFDGASMQELQGHDVRPPLAELGIDLFEDGDRYRVVTSQGDIFSATMPLGMHEGKFDIIFAGFFFDRILEPRNHAAAVQRAIQMLKPASGSVLFGWQIGRERGTTDALVPVDGEDVLAHTEEEFRGVVRHATASMTRRYRVDVDMQSAAAAFPLEDQVRMMRFAITIL